jgi:hypothetical protein
MFWIACFERADEVTVRRVVGARSSQPEENSFVGLWAPTNTAAARVLTRRDGLLALMPSPLQPAYRALADAFAAHLVADYPHGVFFDGDDVFGMIGAEEAATALRGALDAFERLDKDGVAPEPAVLGRLSIAPIFASLHPDQGAEDAAWKWRANLIGGHASDEKVPAFAVSSAELAFAESLPRIEPEWMKQVQVRTKKPWWKFW